VKTSRNSHRHGRAHRRPGTSRLTIDGVAELRPARHHVVTDACQRDVPGLGTHHRRRGARGRRPSEHMEMLLRKIEAMGGGRRTRSGVPHRAQFSGPVTSRRCRIGCGDRLKPLITTMLRWRRRLGRHETCSSVAFATSTNSCASARDYTEASRDDPRRRSLDGDLGARSDIRAAAR